MCCAHALPFSITVLYGVSMFVAVSLFSRLDFSARLQRPGWETRWGDEEKNRVAEEPAGAVAVAGSSAGFAAAGGLDAKAEDVATAPDAPVAAPVVGADGGAAAADTFSVQLSPDDPLRDNLLPDDVAELKSMVRGKGYSFNSAVAAGYFSCVVYFFFFFILFNI